MATHLFIQGQEDNFEIQELVKLDENSKDNDSFVYRFIKFEYKESFNKFKPIIYDIKQCQSDIINKFSTGIDEADVEQLKRIYGPCQLEVPRKSIPALLVDEVLNPFYIFQVFSVILWFWDGY